MAVNRRAMFNGQDSGKELSPELKEQIKESEESMLLHSLGKLQNPESNKGTMAMMDHPVSQGFLDDTRRGLERDQKRERLESEKGLFAQGGSAQRDIIGGSLIDFTKRLNKQPLLETEALFKAFGKGGGLADAAEKGTLGHDFLSDFREGELIAAKEDAKRILAKQKSDSMKQNMQLRALQIQKMRDEGVPSTKDDK